jgi:predicted kinase
VRENLARRQLLERPQVVVLVGTSGGGKTTLRRRLVGDGFPAELVVSLDDLRRSARQDDLGRGRPVRALQDYSAFAVRRAARRADALAAYRAGYLADATHLRRKERREHVLRAADTGLPAVAVLFEAAPLEELLRRNAVRPVDERVPEDVLANQHHRRSLLTADLLRDEGFTDVLTHPPSRP